MQQGCDRVAGLDVHRDIVVACVRVGRGNGGSYTGASSPRRQKR